MAKKKRIRREDLAGRRLVCTGRLAIRKEVDLWLGDTNDLLMFARHNLVDNTVPLVFDGFADAITIEAAVVHYDTKKAVFRPLFPSLESTVVLAWKRFQPTFGAAGRFLDFMREKFVE